MEEDEGQTSSSPYRINCNLPIAEPTTYTNLAMTEQQDQKMEYGKLYYNLLIRPHLKVSAPRQEWTQSIQDHLVSSPHRESPN